MWWKGEWSFPICIQMLSAGECLATKHTTLVDVPRELFDTRENNSMTISKGCAAVKPLLCGKTWKMYDEQRAVNGPRNRSFMQRKKCNKLSFLLPAKFASVLCFAFSETFQPTKNIWNSRFVGKESRKKIKLAFKTSNVSFQECQKQRPLWPNCEPSWKSETFILHVKNHISLN